MRPEAIYQDFDVFLGEVLRDLVAAGKVGPPLRVLALVQALGRRALAHAVSVQLGATSTVGRAGATAGAAVLTAMVGSLGPSLLLPLGAAAGIGWLATLRRVTPMRRRFAALVVTARARWQRGREEWLAGRLSRMEREALVAELIAELVTALDGSGEAVGREEGKVRSAEQ